MRELHLLWSRAAVGRPHSRRANAARRPGGGRTPDGVRPKINLTRYDSGSEIALPRRVGKQGSHKAAVPTWGQLGMNASKASAEARVTARPSTLVAVGANLVTARSLPIAQYQGYPPAPPPQD